MEPLNINISTIIFIKTIFVCTIPIKLYVYATIKFANYINIPTKYTKTMY